MFENIIGNQKIKQEIIQAIKQKKLSHSYMFIGTDGIGKKMIAKEFSKMLLCEQEDTYCNKCKSCLEFDSENHPDFQIIEPDGNSVKIEQIRTLQRKIIEAPIVSEKKVYIINNADTMTVEAQNCLLKTLEEPPKYVNIFLIGSNENNFLSTIKSRCTIIKFQDIKKEEIQQFLEKNYEITQVSDNMFELFGGSIGNAIKLKDKQELYNSVFEIIENIKRLDIIETLKKADIIYKTQEEKNEILDSMNVIFYKKSKEDIRFLNCIDIVEQTKQRLAVSANYNMSIDNMLFNIWEEMH